MTNEKSTQKMSNIDLWRNVRDNTSNQKVLVIHDCLTAFAMAQKNEMYYITDDVEQKNWFKRNVINNIHFGNDDKVELIEDWKNIDKFIEEKFGKNMKFDLIIGNPPYDGKQKLYLKILVQLKKYSEHIIWLCPTNWIDIPCEYWYENKKTVDECINYPCDFISEGQFFLEQGISDNVGIFYFHNEGKTNLTTLYTRLYSKPKLLPSIIDKFKKIKIHLSDKLINSGFNQKKVNENDWAFVSGTYTFPSEKNPKITSYYITQGIYKPRHFEFNQNKIIKLQGKDIPSAGFFVNFSTKKEVLNFDNYVKSPIVKFAFYVVKHRVGLNPQCSPLVPFLDFNKTWTDKEICKELELTKEEYNYICEEMKPYV